LVRHERPRTSLVGRFPQAGALRVRRLTRAATAGTRTPDDRSATTTGRGRLLVRSHLDLGGQHVRLGTTDIERDPSHGAPRKTRRRKLFPRATAVRALID